MILTWPVLLGRHRILLNVNAYGGFSEVRRGHVARDMTGGRCGCVEGAAPLSIGMFLCSVFRWRVGLRPFDLLLLMRATA